MLQLENVRYEVDENGRKKTILKDISFTVDAGEVVAITGHNGGGKTTIARVIAGIVKPSAGRVLFKGEDITEVSVTDRAKKGVAYAFQQPVNFKGLMVRDLLMAASGKDDIDNQCNILSEVGLCARDYIDRAFDASLSGGEKKRLELATVLAREAELNVFDEPEAGIDLWSFDALVELFRKRKGAVVIITHQQKILEVADRIIVVNDSEISEIGKSADVLSRLSLDSGRCARLTERR